MSSVDTSVAGTTDVRDPAEARSAMWEIVQLLFADGLPLPWWVMVYKDGSLTVHFDVYDDGIDWVVAFGLDTISYRTPSTDPTQLCSYYGGDLKGSRIALFIHETATVEQPEATLTAVENDAAKQPDPHANDHARCTPETCEEVQAQWLIAVREAHEEGNHNDCDPDDCEFGMRGFGAVYDASVEDVPVCEFWHYGHDSPANPAGRGVQVGCVRPAGHHGEPTMASELLHRDVNGSTQGPWFPPDPVDGQAAVALAVLSPDEPITDADRISAAADAKTVEAAGEDGL